MKSLYPILFLITILQANINSKISSTKNQLQQNSNKNLKITQTLSELTHKMLLTRKEIESIKKKISLLEKEIKKKREKSHYSHTKLQQKQKKYNKLVKKRDEFNKKLIEIISQLIQIDMMQNQMLKSDDSIKNIINYYAYKSYSRILKYNFNETERKFFSIKIQIAKLKKELRIIDKEQKELQAKIDNLKNLERLKESKEKEIKKEKKRYSIKLAQIQKQNSFLIKELRRLNILKKREKRKKYKRITRDNQSNIKVKFKESSKEKYFDRIPVVKYNGTKTIAPFKKYKIIRKFGKFINPEYSTKVETYNPNIVLKPIGSKNVRNILDGKVLSIIKNPAVGNLIVIGQRNGIHVLYANLSSISSIVKQGRYVKKGFVIGKVKDTLILEVTKNNANINPLELIR